MSFICGTCKKLMDEDCLSIAEEYEQLLTNWKRANSSLEYDNKTLRKELQDWHEGKLDRRYAVEERNRLYLENANLRSELAKQQEGADLMWKHLVDIADELGCGEDGAKIIPKIRELKMRAK